MRKRLFLYLAIACFLGLMVIFVVDGYMGVYDTVKATAGEQEQIIDPDQWYRNRYEPMVGATWGGKIFFTYEVENRRFSSYETSIQASVWQENEKVLDLLSEEKSIEPWGKTSVEWVVDSAKLEARGTSRAQYTIKIERDGVKRDMVVYFSVPYPEAVPLKPPPG